MVVYIKHLSEPWFSLVRLGIKTVEGRLDKKSFKCLMVGDIIVFRNDDFGFQRSCQVEIQKITKYQTFEHLLIDKHLDNCLPGIDTLENGVKVYLHYFDKDDELEFGVLALDIKLQQ